MHYVPRDLQSDAGGRFSKSDLGSDVASDVASKVDLVSVVPIDLIQCKLCFCNTFITEAGHN